MGRCRRMQRPGAFFNWLALRSAGPRALEARVLHDLGQNGVKLLRRVDLGHHRRHRGVAALRPTQRAGMIARAEGMLHRSSIPSIHRSVIPVFHRTLLEHLPSQVSVCRVVIVGRRLDHPPRPSESLQLGHRDQLSGHGGAVHFACSESATRGFKVVLPHFAQLRGKRLRRWHARRTPEGKPRGRAPRDRR